ncbi:sensor histidine kinase [Pigmentiphaga kullae]|uniref:histidine kinase n=1 Tax=Pigmentiphaga kullae TaxID=151784 RepID=A0A4Q7NL11_9BURK|nr:sensor histidine kinase [Pigmentiphaga kullae]RZS85801.1 RsbRD-like negative regulator of sigma factor [Pigmentiphaga kullae]
MRLADFIDANLDLLLSDWRNFARQLDLRRSAVSEHALQTSARSLLRQLAAELRAGPQGTDNGEAAHGVTRQAHVHARNRLRAGFTLTEMVAEFCALRANILERWGRETDEMGTDAREDLVRFNQALDLALKESISRYSAGLERARDLFVGILAHDLRTPLGAIAMSAQALMLTDELPDRCREAATRIGHSGSRMQRMIDDLLDFTRTRLGSPLPLALSNSDLKDVCARALDEIRAVHPERDFLLECQGRLAGRWDANRLAQLLANLLANAVQHGDTDRPVALRVRRAEDGVIAEVHNQGTPIPPHMRHQIFDPLMRGPRHGIERRRTGLGLGLYIARQIAVAHQGTLTVASSESGTTFTLWLPDDPSPD